MLLLCYAYESHDIVGHVGQINLFVSVRSVIAACVSASCYFLRHTRQG